MKFNLNLHVGKMLESYLEIFKKDEERYDILLKQLNNVEKIGSRKNFNGHMTASAYILSSDYKKFIIIHNINLDKWLVPGGHWEEGDNEMYKNSEREAKEETGLNNIELFEWHKKNNFIPIDIDTHEIPTNTRKNEDKHYHHDFRYVFVLKGDEQIDLQLEEVKGYKWLNLSEDIEKFSGNKVLSKIRNII